MNLRDEFTLVTKGKYDHTTADSDRSLLNKELRYIDFLEAKIKMLTSHSSGSEKDRSA